MKPKYLEGDDMMRHFRTALVIALVLIIAPGVMVMAQAGPDELLEAGVYKAEVEGELEAAIEIFEQIIAEHSQNRSVAARALLHLGSSYEKLGSLKAEEAYQRLIGEYSDQPTIVSEARMRLQKMRYRELAEGIQAGNHEDMSIRKIWSDSKLLTWTLGSISPDGRQVSIRTDRFGDLGILELAGKEIHELTDNWTLLAVMDTMPEERLKTFMDSLMSYGKACAGSIWSRDGRYLAYRWVSWSNIGDLCLVGRDGADARVLTAGEDAGVMNIIPYDWSTDGKHILAGGANEKEVVKLLFVSVADGSAKELNTDNRKPGLFSDKARGYFSPDSRYVAFTSAEADIYLVSVDENTSQPLVEHTAHDYVLGWSPDGKWVCFASDRSGTMDIWAIGVNDGKPEGEAQKISRNVGEVIPLGITDNGTLYLGLDAGITDIYVAEIDPETGQWSELPSKVSQHFEGTNDWPEWSPDGKHLLYRSDREVGYQLGVKSPLCVHSMETDEVREVRVPLREFGEHKYSPDGRFALTYGVDNAGQNGLFQIDLDSGLATLLVKCTDDAGIYEAIWSPGGDLLYYMYPQDFDKPSRLVQYDLKTGQEKELIQENSWPPCPVLSPDGQWLTFQTLDWDEGLYSLNILPAAGGPLQRIVTLENHERVYSVDWMPDGKSIVYIKGPPSKREQRDMWQVSIDDKSPRKIGDMEGMSCLSVHPGGRHIAFSALKRQTEIWVVENFLPED